ncbi:MAG: hypothetical protein GTN97_08620 [Nitrosopumilaceae archaeon]|nr:hypothetical protein [Nitrosopumilaceae archaeon]
MVLLQLFLLGALAEEFAGVPKRKRRIKLGLTKREQAGLMNIGGGRVRVGSDFDIFKF